MMTYEEILDAGIAALERNKFGPEDGGDPFYDAIIAFLVDSRNFDGTETPEKSAEEHALAIARAILDDLPKA